MTFHLGTFKAIYDRISNPTLDLEKKTSTPRTTGLVDSPDVNHIYEPVDDTNKDTTERFSPIWDGIQGIYPGTVSNVMDFEAILLRRFLKPESRNTARNSFHFMIIFNMRR